MIQGSLAMCLRLLSAAWQLSRIAIMIRKCIIPKLLVCVVSFSSTSKLALSVCSIYSASKSPNIDFKSPKLLRKERRRHFVGFKWLKMVHSCHKASSNLPLKSKNTFFSRVDGRSRPPISRTLPPAPASRLIFYHSPIRRRFQKKNN